MASLIWEAVSLQRGLSCPPRGSFLQPIGPLWIMLLWTFVYRNLCDCVFSSLGHIQGLEFLDRIVSSMFNFEELPKHFSKWMKSTLWDSNIATPSMGIFSIYFLLICVECADSVFGPSFSMVCVCVFFKQCLLFTWSLIALTSDAVQLAFCCSSALLSSPFSALFWIIWLLVKLRFICF